MLLLLACAPQNPVHFCDAPLRMRYDPRPDGVFAAFPDDHWTIPADTPTGLRISLHPEENPMLSNTPSGYIKIYEDLSTLDGWGLTAGLWLMAEGALPEIDPSRVHLYAKGQQWPVDLSTTDEGSTLMVLPRFPLPEATEAALILSNPDEKSCIAPSDYTRQLLDPSLGNDEEEALRWRRVLAETGIPPEQVAGMSVFTTQSATVVSRSVAEDISLRSYALSAPMSCVENGTGRQCDGLLKVMDYRAEDHIVLMDSDGSPRSSYDLPVRVWLPSAGTVPYPVALCGHGLGGNRGDCDVLAELAGPEGVAVVAVDAVEHGDHPGRTDPGIDLLKDLMIFAITLNPPGLDALRLRDNFRQSAWDKLQVIRAIQEGMDVDGDGTSDLDSSRMAYVGVSLGAIMGPEPLALTDAMQAGVLVVGGGRISSIIQDSPTFGMLVDVMRPPDTTDGEVDRFFPVLQTVVDAGDPMVYGPHVQQQRFSGKVPDALVMLAYEDQIVPNSSNAAFTRGLGVPGVGTEVWPIASLEWKNAPLSGNMAEGATGGMLEFAQTRPEEGAEWEAADHSTLHESVEGRAQIRSFLMEVLNGNTPTIVEPPRP